MPRKLVFRYHAVQRMFQRKVSISDVELIVELGTTIENYPSDEPYPSRLLLGFVDSRPLHVVVADSDDSMEIIIITVYEPELDLWENDFKQRKDRP